MKKSVYEEVKAKALEYYERAHIVLTEEEKANLEVADFGLDDIYHLGLQLVVYINTERVCAKEMVLFEGQTCLEHMHVDTDGNKGKEETFRCRYGVVHLFVEGERNVGDDVSLPASPVTVFHEVVLHPGEQYTIMPYTKHWFRGGKGGCVVSEFSTKSTDETDVWTDNRVVRIPTVE